MASTRSSCSYAAFGLIDKVLCTNVHLRFVAITEQFEDKVENEWVALSAVKYLTLQRTSVILKVGSGRIHDGVTPYPFGMLAQSIKPVSCITIFDPLLMRQLQSRQHW